MFGIDCIDIILNENTFHLDLNRKVIISKDRIELIEEDKITNLLSIIRTWKPIYTNSNILDGERYKIVIKTEQNEEVLEGSGSYPENYSAFKEWISDFIC